MPTESEDDSQRDFADRSLREALHKPDNLRPIVADVAPTVVNHLDFDRMRPIKREFRVGNWRSREADILFEVPYRENNEVPFGEDKEEDSESWMLVCLLIEHQSNTDYLIPFRTLLYAVSYWEYEFHLWEEQKPKPARFQLTPILPIIFHTGDRPWGSAKTLEELLGPPKAFHPFAPTWKPFFWELAKHSEEELLSSNEAFLQTITIFQAENKAPQEAQAIFSQIFEKLECLYPEHRVRRADLIRLLFSWAHHRRPAEEKESWHELAVNLQTNAETKREVANMGLTIAQSLRQEGFLQGKNEGEKIGELQTTRRLLLRAGTKRFGAPTSEITQKIEGNGNVELLSELVENLTDFPDWQAIEAKL